MGIKRRSFVRTVLWGGVSGYCCARGMLPGRAVAAQSTPAYETHVLGEGFSTCHRIRDRREFALPRPSRSCEVVVVGGGPSGLVAGYRLRDCDVLLLEKEPVPGGNARADYWRGMPYAAGSNAFYGASPAAELYAELGLQPRQRDIQRSTLVGDRIVEDLWGEGLSQFFSPAEERQLRQAIEGLWSIDAEREKEPLDAIRFAAMLQPYGPAVKDWFDSLFRYFAATTDACSGYGGLLFTRALMGEGFGPLYPEGKAAGGVFTFPGGLSAAALALSEKIESAGSNRIVTSATVFRIQQDASGVDVSYLNQDQPVTVRAKTAIVAAPKFIGKHLVAGLPARQFGAMAKMVYVPYLVGAVGVRGRLSPEIKSASVIRGPIVSLVDESTTPDFQLFRIEIPVEVTSRAQLLSESGVHELAGTVAGYFEQIFPGAREQIEQIRLWRRGHNWFLPVPGMVTGFQKVASKSFGRIHFANADSIGPVSDFGWAMLAADRAVLRARRDIG